MTRRCSWRPILCRWSRLDLMGATNTPAPMAAGGSGAGSAGRPGQLAEEYEALRRGCGLATRYAADGADTMEMLGPDRHRFLNAYVTCEVKGLAAGQGTYGFFTSAQGRILADVVVIAHADRFWLELPPGRQEAIAEHLRKYLIADRVEMRSLGEVLPLTLAGPGAAPALTALAFQAGGGGGRGEGPGCGGR